MNIVFDLDGTLADCTHRLPLIYPKPPTGTKPDWERFFAACGRDKPIQSMIDLAGQLAIYNHIEVWTGRPERVRTSTTLWLLRHLGRSVSGLRMRADDDRREDYAVKAEYLDTAGFKPDVVFEDRTQVVAMYRARGILCLQVAEGNY